MNKGKELAKNTAIITIGKMSTQLISFLLLPLYTAVLSTEEYGIVDLVITYMQLLLPICTLQLEQAIFRFVLEKRDNEAEKKRVFSELFTLALLMVIFFSIIFFLVSPFIQSEYKFFLWLDLVANIYGQLMLQSARGVGRNGTYAIGSFIAAAGQVLLNILFVLVLRWGPRGMFISMLLAYFVCGTYIFISLKLYKYVGFVRISFKKSLPYLKYSIPLVPNTISWWILNAADRTIILSFLGIAANGIYSAANKFSGIYATIYNIFNLSWTESVAVHFKENGFSEEFSELQDKMIKIFGSIYIGLIAVMPFVFRVLVNEKFNGAYNHIPILLTGAFFSAMAGMISAYYIAEKMTSIIAKMTMFAAFLNVVINLILIKRFGLYAASISTLISYFVIFILRYIDVRKRFGIVISRKEALSLFVMAFITWLCYYLGTWGTQAICLLIVVLFAYIQNKEIVISLEKVIKEKILK